jgi:4-hydroxy-3-methylbut-2-enyl diphosphate reductase
MKCSVGKWVGFCSGVQRAIRGAEKVLEKNSVIDCLGEIIHNPRVVKELERRGMVVVRDIEEIPDSSSFIIRSHGLEEEIVMRARDKMLTIHDFTCPKVKNTHHLVSNLRSKGYRIFIVGNPLHPEVKAIQSIAGPTAQVLVRKEAVAALDAFERIAVVVQTTFDPRSFSSIVSKLILRAEKTLVCNTLCEETIKRQNEADKIAGNVDFMIVVGGKNSSNTKTLYNIVKERVPALHIEDAFEIERIDLSGVKRIGIVSGASTPVEEVKKVYEKLSCQSG